MAYTDRFYAGLEDDPIPDDPFRKAFGGGQPTPSPTPKPASTPIQVAGTTRGILRAAPIPSPTPGPLGSQINLQRSNAASRVSPVPQFDKNQSLNLTSNAAIGVPNQSNVPSVAPRMTHTELAVDIARRNLAAQYPSPVEPAASPTTTKSSDELSSILSNLSPYGLQVQRFGNAGNRRTLQDQAFRIGSVAGSISSATAGGQPLQTATQPGQGALDIVPTGTPLMSQKGIVNPFTGQTQYQPLNQPSPYQGPGQYQVQQAATDFYRQRQEEKPTGYGSAY